MTCARVKCERCGKDITMSGSAICGTCDPDIEALIASGKKAKTPDLCDACFAKHSKEHEDEKR